MAVQQQTKFDVGGVELDRPFKIRRLGHFGINVRDVQANVAFYTRLLGFRISDTVDFGRMLDEQKRGEAGETGGVFMRHGTDHHSFVLFPRRAFELLSEQRAGRPVFPADVTINQITWQVGSLSEVVDAIRWFKEEKRPIMRTGRDMPGSNWHVYMPDLESHINELYYGIEQIGWDGFSKPLPMRERVFFEPPSLPQVAELAEVQQALSKSVDLQSGYRYVDDLPASYEVDGILLPRPFKIVRVGPVGLFVRDVAAAEPFYTDTLGFVTTERVTFAGAESVFLRTNTDHHALALYPIQLREGLGFDPGTTLATFGLQVANYRQLKGAVRFLTEHGCEIRQIPPELHPGIDYAACVRDPDGHTLQLYYSMEQIGWDGQARSAAMRPKIELGVWPDRVALRPDTFAGEAFLGPWG